MLDAAWQGFRVELSIAELEDLVINLEIISDASHY